MLHQRMFQERTKKLHNKHGKMFLKFVASKVVSVVFVNSRVGMSSDMKRRIGIFDRK